MSNDEEVRVVKCRFGSTVPCDIGVSKKEESANEFCLTNLLKSFIDMREEFGYSIERRLKKTDD